VNRHPRFLVASRARLDDLSGKRKFDQLAKTLFDWIKGIPGHHGHDTATTGRGRDPGTAAQHVASITYKLGARARARNEEERSPPRSRRNRCPDQIGLRSHHARPQPDPMSR